MWCKDLSASIGTLLRHLVSLCLLREKFRTLIDALVQTLFRIAFAIFIFVQGLTSALIPAYWRTDSGFVVFLIVLTGIGFGNYCAFQRLTRKRSIRIEANRWSWNRKHLTPQRLKHYRRAKQFTVWVPVATVVLMCIFFDEIFAFASHLFHPNSDRLIGYEVPIPLNWAIFYSAPYENEAETWSYVAGHKTDGLLRSGIDFLLKRKISFSMSEMAFYGAAGAQLETNRHSPFGDDRLLSSHQSAFGNGEIECSNYLSSYYQDVSYREIACATPKGDFSCFFGGDEKDVEQFYQTLKAVRPVLRKSPY